MNYDVLSPIVFVLMFLFQIVGAYVLVLKRKIKIGFTLIVISYLLLFICAYLMSSCVH